MLCTPIKDLSKVSKYQENYIFESKKDGVRCFLAYTKSRGIALRNRDNIDITNRYPELQGIKFGFDVLLDGEIVLEKNNKCDFSNLMSREHLKDVFKINLLSKKHPVKFFAFDMLFCNDKSIYGMPLHERKEMMIMLNPYESPYFEVIPHSNSIDKAKEWLKTEEGIILKRKDSTYQFNTRSTDWLKVKNHIDKLVRFYKYEVNTDRSITLTDDFHRVKCNDLLAKTRIDTYGFVDCEVTGLEFTESNHIRQPIIKRIVR